MSATALMPLTKAEKARVAKNIELVKAIHPEMAGSIKALRAAGFDIGWRDISYTGPQRPEPINSLHAGQLVLESTAELKERVGLNGHR